ncbi:MAG: cupin domain-containing protein [Pseudomonadota bacterium]
MTAPEFWTDERCFITELVNVESLPNASLARCRVEPGTLTQKHALTVREWYVIIAGTGEMFVGDARSFPVAPGDVVDIPANTSQQIHNTGEHDLVFHCLCMPRFSETCYRSLEDDPSGELS